MPELPDIETYIACLRPRVEGKVIRRLRVVNPFLVRSVDPPIAAAEGKAVRGLRRMGKRIVFELDDGLFLVLHLMIAGRLRWSDKPVKMGLAQLVFDEGTLAITEAGTKRRAALHLVRGEAAVKALDPGGMEVMGSEAGAFAAALRSQRHTLKRSLTDPHLFSGIGNAYSDEILHAARLSPFKMSDGLTDEEIGRLHRAMIETFEHWTGVLKKKFATRFPGAGDITAFRPGFAVHGRFGEPCPVCGAPVQRICYAENETNYCARCQTEGRILADRSLSRLLHEDWPRRIEELG